MSGLDNILHAPVLIILAVLVGLLIAVVIWEFRRKEKQHEHLPWYRARNYKGNLTEAEKRQLDFFRMQEKHPAADYDSLPEEVKRYISDLEMEVYDNKQQTLALGTLIVSGIGGYFFIRLILGYDDGSLFSYVGSISLLILPWLWYRIKWRKNANEFLPEDGPSPTYEAILKEWELNYIINKEMSARRQAENRPSGPERPQSQSPDDGPPGEAEAVAKIKHLCWMAGMSAESVALDKKSGTPPENWDEYEHSRYQKLRDEALQLTDKLTDEFYRSTAVHFLVETHMKADDVDGARALLAQCKVDFIRKKIVEQYPELNEHPTPLRPTPPPVVSPAEPPRTIHEPVVSDDNVGKDVKPPLSGIAGWLILIVIGQVVGVIKLLAWLVKYYGDADPKLFQQFPVTVWGEALLNIGLVGLMIYTAVLFFQKSRRFPQFFIYEWMFVIFVPLIDMVWVALTLSLYTGRPFAEFAELDPQTVGETIAAIIGAAVWITYIKKSRRVANTFTK